MTPCGQNHPKSRRFEEVTSYFVGERKKKNQTKKLNAMLVELLKMDWGWNWSNQVSNAWIPQVSKILFLSFSRVLIFQRARDIWLKRTSQVYNRPIMYVLAQSVCLSVKNVKICTVKIGAFFYSFPSSRFPFFFSFFFIARRFLLLFLPG